jgi:predicted acyltransferase
MGAIRAPLRHAEWHGATPTDLVFPFFVFITGASMTFSVHAARARGIDDAELARRRWKRCALVFLTGVALNGFPFYDVATLRIPGVLQRIALASLLAGVFVGRTRRATVVAGVALLAIHTALLLLVPAPGRDAVSLLKGGDLGAAIDLAVFGKAHLWSGGGGL